MSVVLESDSDSDDVPVMVLNARTTRVSERASLGSLALVLLACGGQLANASFSHTRHRRFQLKQ